MSFIKNSVNYSQTDVVKKQLRKVLQACNDVALRALRTPSNQFTAQQRDAAVAVTPNNGKKYYTYVFRKTLVEDGSSPSQDYDVMYFFPDPTALSTDRLQQFRLSDFYVETQRLFDTDVLFEGYMYDNNEYLVTNVLFKGGVAVDPAAVDAETRFCMVNELLFPLLPKLKNLNDTVTVGIHPFLSSSRVSYSALMLHNFKHKAELAADCDLPSEVAVTQKLVTKTKLPDVFMVAQAETRCPEGMLYVPSVKHSKYLRTLFAATDTTALDCVYNRNFKKWQVVDAACQGL